MFRVSFRRSEGARARNMKKGFFAFNMILALGALCFIGCETTDSKKKEKKGKEATFLRFHLETNPDGTQHNAPVPVYRSKPMYINVERNAALDEGFMKDAEVVDVDEHGGYAIKITCNPQGTQRLDYLTTANKGKRVAINARWTEDRWLAAPLITKRIANGVFIFTPDASREEAERIVKGLKNVIKKLSQPYTF
jgi:preprotein translocase subunit SecD